jgi:hypothetical protein
MRATGVKPVMDKEIIQQIATEVVHRLPYGDHPWLFLLVTVLVMALGAGLAAWFGAFFKIKGENFATKRDFDELLKQQKATAEAIEKIKSDVAQRDWARREWTNLRRIKLEALLEKMHDCKAFLNVQRRKAIDGEIEAQERDKWNELDEIGTLYFRELKNEVDNFYIKCVEQGRLNIELARAIKRASNEADDPTGAPQRALEAFREKWAILERELQVAHDELTAAARTLLGRIMNVDEQATSDER